MIGSKVLRVARWEVSHRAGTLDRRTVLVALLGLLAVTALGLAISDRGMRVDDGIYRIAVPEGSPYYEPAALDPTFTVVSPGAGQALPDDADLGVVDGHLTVRDTPKGRAGLAEFRTTIEQYNDRQMATEPDQAAAFPISVTLLYERQESTGVTNVDLAAGSGSQEGVGSAGSAPEFGSSADGGSSGTDGASAAGGGASGGGGIVPSLLGGSSSLGQSTAVTTPSNIAPPFPFGSLVLAFLFVVPMNFVVQAYASSVLEERIGRRGELLLVAPISRWTIIVGKTLPYFVGMVTVATITATLIGAGTSTSVLSIVPIAIGSLTPVALTFLGCSFVAASFARSFKELTFLTVAISVSLTSYVFVPAIFTDVHPIAVISPLTLVVQGLQGTGVQLTDYVFSTLPFYLTAALLFALGAGIYREEDLFTQRPVHLKAVDALGSGIKRRASAAKLSALSMPFVLAAELIVLAGLFALPLGFSLPVLLLSIAFIEEVAKSVHVHAGFLLGTYPSTLFSASVVGAFSGLGFFLGEKLVLVAQLVGLPDLQLGQAAFGPAIGAGPFGGLPLPVLLLAPLFLHVVTATISSVGASRGSWGYALGLVTATLVHAVYNLTVVSAVV